MKTVRFAVIGLGAMGREHARSLAASAGEELALTAVSDANADAAHSLGAELNTPAFSDVAELLASGLADAAVVATPHYLHPPLTIQAARAGLHVLCEKPLAVTVGDARAMVAECRSRRRALGVMFQSRTRGVFRAAKAMIDAGELGTLRHVDLTVTQWYRTQAYYDSGTWRGTWDGEGGGILMNQAPHHLDLYQWLAGMPDHVSAVLSTRLHRIEVENTADALLRHGPEMTGHVHASTIELPRRDEWRIGGDRGVLLITGAERLRIGRLAECVSKHVFSCPEKRADFIPEPECVWEDVRVQPDPADARLEVLRAFARHIRNGTPMVASGVEALGQVELTNAIYLSGFENRPVEVPVDAARMERLLSRLVRGASGRGGNLRDEARRAMRRIERDVRRPARRARV